MVSKDRVCFRVCVEWIFPCHLVDLSIEPKEILFEWLCGIYSAAVKKVAGMEETPYPIDIMGLAVEFVDQTFCATLCAVVGIAYDAYWRAGHASCKLP